MSGFAICLTALALAQGGPAASEPGREMPSSAESAPRQKEIEPATTGGDAAPPSPPPARAGGDAEAGSARGGAAPTPAPAASETRTGGTRAPSGAAQRPAPSAATTARPVREPAATGGASPPAPRSRPPSPQPTPPASGTGGAPAAARTEPEREQAGRIARAFLEALAAGDATALAQASSDRFSFDGEPQSGRSAVARTWRELLAGRRGGAAPPVSAVEVLSAQDALARYGKPPARVAPLVRTGVWVAVGDVGGRPVVLFLAREDGRVTVIGLHD